MNCHYENKKLCYDVIYSFFYIQMLFFMIMIFFYKLFFIMDRQLIKYNNLIEHKKKYKGVVESINKTRDKRKWVYNVIN